MDRRRCLHAALAWPLAGWPAAEAAASVEPSAAPCGTRVRPGDPDWPSDARWAELARQVGGRLQPVVSPLLACRGAAPGSCDALFASLNNPWLLGDDPALTQTLGWTDAWTSMPSAYAVAARGSDDVAAAVRFAREHRLRLVVKGGGHSYHGTSNAAGSLLVWTRALDEVRHHDAFVPEGCPADGPVTAVSVGGGALWGPVYDAVSTGTGRYVQGGGCLTVGVAGLVQSGGFGSFSKAHGLAAAGLLEAEVVTADGVVRVVNRCREPELFWALRGGGGGNFGVVTRLTLRTHSLPRTIGAVNMTLSARDDEAWRRLVGLVVEHIGARLVDPHWGEQIRFVRGRRLVVSMVFFGIDRGQASDTWQPFIDAVRAQPRDWRFEAPPFIVGLPARRFWDPGFLRWLPGVVKHDARAGAPAGHVFWSGDQGQAGQVLQGYQSAWLPASLLDPERRAALADALVAASRQATVSLHLNKGLAGAAAEVREAARACAIHPAVADAFALAITAASAPAAYPGVAGHEPDVAAARRGARAVAAAIAELRRVAPDGGSYYPESDYFEADWARAHWGGHVARLAAAKQRYDPEGLFFVHHAVGSEQWEDDGYAPRSAGSRP